MKKLATIFGMMILGVSLGGCPDDSQPIRIINQTSAPNLPDIILPAPADLEKVIFDLPPDVSRLIVKNTSACQSVEPANRTLEFWKVCGQYVTARGTEIYLSLDKNNYLALINNLEKLRLRDKQFTYRLEQVNLQRKAWRDQNALNNKAISK